MTSDLLLRPPSTHKMAPNRGPPQTSADLVSMRFESSRLATFADWPLDAPVPKERLAKAGFFFKSAPLRVECFACGGCVDDWQLNDQVMPKHRALNASCAFVTNSSDNVPVTGVGSPVPRDSGYSSSQSPASSQGSGASTSPRTGFRFPTVAAPTQQAPALAAGQSRSWHSFSFLKRERYRLRTFANWPMPHVSADELAAAGFFCLRDGDKAQCIFCRGIVGDWEAGDVPMTEHSRHFPHCSFVCGREVGNVPADADSDTDDELEELPVGGLDEVGHRIDYRTRSVAESAPRIQTSQLNVCTPHGYQHTGDLAELGISEHYAPVHPSYATVESRMRSYQFWPPALAQKPIQLAEAGFFYAGVSDHVKCFQCDGGLRNWVPGDEPWTEHARWFSRCGFVRLVKGDEFIHKVLREHPQHVAPTAPPPPADTTAVTQCSFTDEEVEEMMENAICKTAVELGVAREAVKRVLKQRLESTGLPFTDLSSVLALAVDHTQATYQSAASSHEAGPSHVRVGSTLSAASSGADSGMEDARSQDNDMDVRPDNTSTPTDVAMTSQISQESSQSTLTNSSGSGGDLTPKVLSPSAAPPHSDSNLQEEYQRLKEQKQCKVCMDEEVGVVFLPCGHLITCVNCAPALRDCPLCRQPIRGTVRTYLS